MCFLSAIHARDASIQSLSDLAFQSLLRDVRTRLRATGFSGQPMADAFALVREATRRTLGMAHYDSQLIAGRIMLNNRLAEMATGEGKTLTAALGAATIALAGMPVHVITANDYLVSRDAELLAPVYRMLGVTVGTVTQPMAQAQRRTAYASDITYCTAKEVVFDYLRDRLVRRKIASDLHERVRQLDQADDTGVAPQSGLLLRGLWMALIDEADSILIDEARTPLVLSASRVNVQRQDYFKRALGIASRLSPRTDFKLDRGTQVAQLTDVGCEKLTAQGGAIGGLWQDRRHREETIRYALAAMHLFVRDRDYLVRDKEVILIDQTTGRVAPGRVWSRGLHQLIEAKEGCPPSDEQETIAQITYQRFFPRYLRLGGMSGTLQEAATELRSVYGLKIMRVPLRKPSRRKYVPLKMYSTRDEKWQEVVTRAQVIHRKRRPVLIGTDSVADSDYVSRLLNARQLAHTVLNARHDSEEAAIVSKAGEAGQIMVTTNMAGRGTDIALGDGVRALGGLYVISCQHNASGRIDRQLHGRCARQGDPGTVETILCLEDPVIALNWPAWVRRIAGRLQSKDGTLPVFLGKLLAYKGQRSEERGQRVDRKALLEQDKRAEQQLSFAGQGE